jgi:hypothetical protein
MDHCPETFQLVLDYLRYGKIHVPKEERLKLRAQAEYFSLSGLLQLLDEVKLSEQTE